MWTDKPIVLASQSPRRKQLLTKAGISFTVFVKHTDEQYPASLPIVEVPQYIASNKANAISTEVDSESIILAADTVVVLHGLVINKPATRQEAIHMLHQLSGQKHEVITGVCLLCKERNIHFADITEVYFRTLREEQILYYVDHYQPYDKAGAYAIQEWIGLVAIEKINGCYFNVMGLPVGRVLQCLQQL